MKSLLTKTIFPLFGLYLMTILVGADTVVTRDISYNGKIIKESNDYVLILWNGKTPKQIPRERIKEITRWDWDKHVKVEEEKRQRAEKERKESEKQATENVQKVFRQIEEQQKEGAQAKAEQDKILKNALSGKITDVNERIAIVQKNTCWNYIRQFEAAKDQFALEHGVVIGSRIEPEKLNSYLTNLSIYSSCPSGGKYLNLDAIGAQIRCTVHGVPPESASR